MAAKKKGFMKEICINGAVVQAYPLTPAQMLHMWTGGACKRWELLNIGTGFYIEFDDVDFDVLKECIYEGYRQFEAMRLRFYIDENGTPWQYIVPNEDRPINLCDMSDWQEEDAHNEMSRWNHFPLNIGGPMNEITMIKLPGNYNGIFMKVSHLIMDSTAIAGFYSYVLNLYCSKKFDDIDPPKPPRSYLEQLQVDLAYVDSDAYKKDEAYWMGLLNEPEPIYTSFSSRNRLLELREAMKNPELRSAYNSGDIEAAIKVYDLEDEPSQRLIAFSKEYHIPVACVLLLALRTTFSHFSGNEQDVSVKNCVARRGNLSETNSGGTRIHFFPIRTIIPPETTFLEALKIIQAKENALLRHANYDCIKYMGAVGAHYGAPQGTTYECTTLTYQPVSAAALRGKNIPEINYKSRWYTNGVAMQHIYVTVMHRPTDNGFTFNFEYQKKEVTEDELEKLYFYLCRVIFKGLEDPNVTIGEILDWM